MTHIEEEYSQHDSPLLGRLNTNHHEPAVFIRLQISAETHTKRERNFSGVTPAAIKERVLSATAVQSQSTATHEGHRGTDPAFCRHLL